VPLRVSDRTLEQLEWPQLMARLAAHARTPGGRWRCAPEVAATLLADEAGPVRERLAETSEARRILDAGEFAPLEGLLEMQPVLERARRGGALAARDLLDLAAALAAVEATKRFLARWPEQAPRLVSRAEALGDHRSLQEEIGFSLDPEGQVRDAVSPLLAEARAEVRRYSVELQRRLSQALHDPAIAPHLSDTFVTVRNDRYVLPVRSDARGRVPGIVHDASASGTTLFIEPEAVVDLNNRLKEAELRIARESERILRELSQRVQQETSDIRDSLEGLEEIDWIFARALLSSELEAVEPELSEEGVFVLNQLRHPLLPLDRVVPNDLHLGETFHVLVLSGPNAGGKTVAMKAAALATLGAHAGLHVPAAPGATVGLVESLLADIGDAQSLRESLSTFSAHMGNLARIVKEASARSLVVLDEVGEGTDPGEGAALAQATLEALADSGARVIATTHYNLLKELAAVDPRFENACVEFDPETLAPTYRLRLGSPGVSSATAVAARMGLGGPVLERANELLEREDRRLERTLAELSESRLALERERREVQQLRTETDGERRELRSKLEQLQERRDRLFRSMREELERAFRQAHGEVASVIRELQRGGSARDAAQAREKLLTLQEEAHEAEAALEETVPEPEELDPVDWRYAKPGDPVRIRGSGEAVLLALPDRRGRAAVRVGSARLVLPAEQLGRTALGGGPQAEPPSKRVSIQAEGVNPEHPGGTVRCDLRGLRVEEAVAQVNEELDRAALAGRRRLVIIHGLGTGALRDAVRAHLAESPYAASFSPGESESGGDGVTVVELAE
jgi:DNA mismatch repair protein MutS2